METDLAFYRRRAEEERFAAIMAGTHSARVTHRQLADEYARRVRAFEADDVPDAMAEPLREKLCA